MPRTPPSLPRTFLAIGAFLAATALVSAGIAVLYEAPLLDAARGHARLLRREPTTALQAMVTNPQATDVERLAGLRALRERAWDEPGVRDEAVCDALIELARRTDDSAVRADVLRQMSHCVEPVLKAYLIECIESDPDEDVRSEAVETLYHYLALDDADGTAEAAMRAALEGDPSQQVRDEARYYLD